MWTMVSAAIEGSGEAEKRQIRQKLGQFLAQRRFVRLLPGTVAVDLYTPADIEQVGAALAAIASDHPGHFFFAALGGSVGQYPRMRPKQPPFDKAAFIQIVGSSLLAVAPAVADEFPDEGDDAFADLVAASNADTRAARRKKPARKKAGRKASGKKVKEEEDDA